jgi:myo-inositol 2-dehydrogenase / D-chiro-inositol 1-dehydrogenase
MPGSPTDHEAPRARELSRRRFLADAGATALAFSIVKPDLVRGSQANAKVDLGIIGCGGRGTWIADLFRKHGGYNIVALADYFPDRVEAAGNKLGVPAERRFTGLSAYRRLLEQKLDAVAIESPPFFHPSQATDAVAAGKHVYLAKPVAVDVPGCMTIEQSARKATASQRCFLVDFQTRATTPFIEALRRVHAGALGTFIFGEATYHAEDPFLEQVEAAQSGTPEGILRGWGLSREYSGDIITEQNIHTLDVMNWIMAKPPLAASGTGGRKFRSVGTCCDTFSVTYKYSGDVGIAFTSRQFDGFGTRPEGIRNRMFGTAGVLETEYGGQVLVRGKDFYNGGKTEDIYERGVVTNIAAFHDAIAKSDYSNPTVADSVRSNLVTILGRTAAYEGRVVTWEELTKSDERLLPDLKGLKD